MCEQGLTSLMSCQGYLVISCCVGGNDLASFCTLSPLLTSPGAYIYSIKPFAAQQAQGMRICCSHNIQSWKRCNLGIPVVEVPCAVCLGLVHMKWFILHMLIGSASDSLHWIWRAQPEHLTLITMYASGKYLLTRPPMPTRIPSRHAYAIIVQLVFRWGLAMGLNGRQRDSGICDHARSGIPTTKNCSDGAANRSPSCAWQ